MQKLLIIETYYEGHYLTGYIKYILRSLKKENIEITLLTSNKTLKYGKGALKILNEEKVKFKVITIDFDCSNNFFTSNLYFQQIYNYIKIKELFRKKLKYLNYDLVCFTSLQRFIIPLTLFGNPFNNISIIGIFLGLKFHLKYFNIQQQGKYDLIYQILFKFFIAKKFIKNVITNDHLLKKFANRYSYNLGKKLLFFHDPKETRFKFNKKKIRKSLNLSSKYKYILIYGALIESKGLGELIKILNSNTLNKNFRLIIAGKQFGFTKILLKTKEVRKLVKEKKIKIFNGWQDEIMEAKLFSAIDIVWVAYKNYTYPSGVLYQAASLGLPVINSTDGLINQLNNKHNFGISIKITDVDEAANKLNYLLKKKVYSRLSENIKKFYFKSKPKRWTEGFLKIIKNI